MASPIVSETGRAAPALGIPRSLLDVHGPSALDTVLAAMTSARAEALLVPPFPLFDAQRHRILAVAAQRRLPVMATAVRRWVEEGALLFYRMSSTANDRRAAAYVDTILKGATPGVELAPGPRRRAVRGTPRRRHTRSGSRFAAALSPREHPASASPAPAAAALPAQAARRRRLALLGAAGRYLNWGITLSEISRMVFITTSRGTEAVQLTSNIISSELKFSRRKWILSTTSSGVPNRLASTAVSGLADPASVLPMPALPA
jgi:hypothetical protein